MLLCLQNLVSIVLLTFFNYSKELDLLTIINHLFFFLDIGEEISKLRESYGFKTPIANKLSESDKRVESNDDFVNETEDIFQGILRTPEKSHPKDNMEFTLDDILGGDGSPILEGKVWRNPFSSSNHKKEKQSIKPGGALDRFSKLRRTVVEEACIVQSR